jgi:gluconate 2-dehydrogenase gamma chain
LGLGGGCVREDPSTPRRGNQNLTKVNPASTSSAAALRSTPTSATGHLNRRTFLAASLAAVASVPALAQAALEQWDWRFLTLKESTMLAVLCDVIIPPDQNAGAAAAGTVVFIDRKLVGYHRHFQPLYRDGLSALDSSSEELFQKPLVELSPDQCIALVTRWEIGDLPKKAWKQTNPREFFDRFLDHVMQGYFGGPRHGGNRDAVSWRMLGLPQPPVRSRRPESPRRLQP